MREPSADIVFERREYTVGELTEEIGALLSDAYANIWVSGEVSGFKLAASGHAYFTIKDDKAALKCACWKGAYRLLRFKPQDGVEVLLRGRIEVYNVRGEYQLIVDAVQPIGAGALQAAFEKLKKKLAAEGLFESDRKKLIPKFPRNIGIVTSPTGAVIRDILHVIERRFRGAHVRVFPALVQGHGAAEQVAAGVRYFNENPWADVVIVARGGGSIEDLWAFNEEPLARAIAASTVPVISAVGHETDFTIADFVADLRAPTPSAAAEIVTASRETVLDQLRTAEARMKQDLRLRLASAARRLQSVSTQRALTIVERRLFRTGQRVDDASQSAKSLIAAQLTKHRTRFNALEQALRRLDLRLIITAAKRRNESLRARLDAARAAITAQRTSRLEVLAGRLQSLNPLQILARGFAVVSREDGAIVRNPAQMAPGTPIRIRLAEGEGTAVATTHQPVQ
ncbi:MAG: exodeoxyribonuclease VII large subunit [Acidobacteria bacterium]|nr:exodeoxyribonuclease VII large subunit [Acidobacteriota bacterium]